MTHSNISEYINLTEFAKKTLEKRYMLDGETHKDFFMRVSIAYSDDNAHALRMYSYITKKWFMPATPVLTNGGTSEWTKKKLRDSALYPDNVFLPRRGLPISCFVNETEDSLDGLTSTWKENVYISANGGGIGTYIGNVRSCGEKVRENGSSGGVIPFIKVMDSMTLAISQGNLRRGAASVYLDVSHPEIEEFIYLRKATGGDYNRRSLNLHHGIIISDEFMNAVENDEQWHFKSPKTKENVGPPISARALLAKIITVRLETGEPYIIFGNTVNNNMPEIQKKLGLKIRTSNLCSEITLPTGVDFNKKTRTGVCCLGSVNLEFFKEFEENDLFIEDCMRFLDNVLTDFEKSAPTELANAIYSVKRERSVGLGAMGLHSFFQKHMISIESLSAKLWNNKMFKHIGNMAKEASKILAKEKGPCEDAKLLGIDERFSNTMAIAPTASISIITNCSPGIEPVNKNIYNHKTIVGSFIVKNKYLEGLLEKKGKNNEEVWGEISRNEGSVQTLDFLSQEEKRIFKTAFEIKQKCLIEMAGDRQKHISQGQSLNLFYLPDINKSVLLRDFIYAWKHGVKGMYYARSMSFGRVENEESAKKIRQIVESENMLLPEEENGECESCQ